MLRPFKFLFLQLDYTQALVLKLPGSNADSVSKDSFLQCNSRSFQIPHLYQMKYLFAFFQNAVILFDSRCNKELSTVRDTINF